MNTRAKSAESTSPSSGDAVANVRASECSTGDATSR